MELDQLQKSWDEWGRRDPLWVILTVPGKSEGKWDVDEFFATGRGDIARLFATLSEMGFELPERRRALDFGCGVGRLTQALCAYFDECVGIDIAPSMIEQAESYNRFGDRCRYVVNASNDLRQFTDGHFDLIYCKLVLQHMAPEYARNYLAEFMRVLAPGGMLAFQLPSELYSIPEPSPPPTPPARRPWFGARLFGLGRHAEPAPEQIPNAVMNGIPRDEVISLLQENGGMPLSVKEDGAAGEHWRSYSYLVTKERA